MDNSALTAVPYLGHKWRRYPIEVWPDVTPQDLARVAANVMETSIAVYENTHYPVLTDDEIHIITEDEPKLQGMNLYKLRKKDEIQVDRRLHRRCRDYSDRLRPVQFRVMR
jgi:hypothetical protein